VCGPLGECDHQRVFAGIDVLPVPRDGAALRANLDLELERKGGDLGPLLRLFDVHVHEPVFVADLELQLGVAAAEHPLVEEAFERAPRYRLERAHQVVRLDDAVRVFRQVAAHAGEERVVAELAPQQVQDQRAFFVKVAVEQVDRLGVVAANDRPRIAGVRLRQVRLQIALNAMVVFIAAQAVFALDVLEVGGETLVQPGVRPVAAGDEVAEPLVGELVGDQVVSGNVERGAGVDQRVLVQGGGGGVLHTAEHEVADHDLRVARPRKGRAGEA
jgi:hypothetical protein